MLSTTENYHGADKIHMAFGQRHDLDMRDGHCLRAAPTLPWSRDQDFTLMWSNGQCRQLEPQQLPRLRCATSVITLYEVAGSI